MAGYPTKALSEEVAPPSGCLASFSTAHSVRNRTRGQTVLTQNRRTMEFDFDQLPDLALLEIFRRLALDQQIRLGRVSRSFQRMSIIAISETRDLDLNSRMFKRLDSPSIILDHCHHRLEKIEFSSEKFRRFRTSYCMSRSMAKNWVAALTLFDCPRLTEVDLGNAPIGNDLFNLFLKRQPTLRRITWRPPEETRFDQPPPMMKKLERIWFRIWLYECGENFFRSFSGKCPNLKALNIGDFLDVSLTTLDAFFAQCPNLESCMLWDTTIDYERLVNFWRLQLKSFVVTVGGIHSMSLIENVTKSFDRLEWLYLKGTVVAPNTAFGRLARLKNLKGLLVRENETMNGDWDDGIRKLVACKNLETLAFTFGLSVATIELLLVACPHLRFVVIGKFTDVLTIDSAISTVRLLGVSGKDRGATIMLDDSNDGIWMSPEVEAEMNAVKEAGGPVIKLIKVIKSGDQEFFSCMNCVIKKIMQ